MSSTADNTIASKLLEQAVHLFATKGYPATSTREIVAAAGVTKPMLYYYFQNKEGLLAASIEHFVGPFHARLREVFERTLAPRDLLVELVWAHLAFCQDHKPLARLFFALHFGPDDQKELVDLERYTEPGHVLLAEGVTRAIDGGLVRPALRDEFLIGLHGMINIWVIATLKNEFELKHVLAERIVDGLLGGYGASSLLTDFEPLCDS